MKLPKLKGPKGKKSSHIKRLFSEFENSKTFNRLMFLSMKNKKRFRKLPGDLTVRRG